MAWHRRGRVELVPCSFSAVSNCKRTALTKCGAETACGTVGWQLASGCGRFQVTPASRRMTSSPSLWHRQSQRVRPGLRWPFKGESQACAWRAEARLGARVRRRLEILDDLWLFVALPDHGKRVARGATGRVVINRYGHLDTPRGRFARSRRSGRSQWRTYIAMTAPISCAMMNGVTSWGRMPAKVLKARATSHPAERAR
jgi:hypothetical protein